MRCFRRLRGLWLKVVGACLLLGLLLAPTVSVNLPPSVSPQGRWALAKGHGSFLAAWTNLMTEDFEGDFPTGLWRASGDPTWGKDDCRSLGGTYSAWCAKGGASGRDPCQPSDYADDMSAWMIYGPFDLGDADDAEWHLSYWNKSESDVDELFWGASINGQNFFGSSRSGDSDGWQSVNFDLTDVHQLGDLVGQPRSGLA